MRSEAITFARQFRFRILTVRGLSNVTLDANQGDVEDVLNRNIVSCHSPKLCMLCDLVLAFKQFFEMPSFGTG